MKLYIKNMVSNRCKMIVKSELETFGFHYITIELGEVEILENLSLEQKNKLNKSLKKSGFVILDDKKSILVERIKNIIIELVHYSEEQLKINLSDYLSEKLKHDYTYLANLFSENQGNTIEQFLIAHRIERVKELIIYNELNITEIAYKMHYSSVAHLSNQFKRMTGMTPSHYKHLKHKTRKSIEKL
jgi:AraC-like DNA-binding protein